MTDTAEESDETPAEDEKLGDFLAEMATSDGEPVDSVAAVREFRERDRGW